MDVFAKSHETTAILVISGQRPPNLEKVRGQTYRSPQRFAVLRNRRTGTRLAMRRVLADHIHQKFDFFSADHPPSLPLEQSGCDNGVFSIQISVFMPTFGSFALLLALALSGYNLLAGAIALRQLATGGRGRVSPERLAETARRAGIGSFIAVTCAAFALVWAAFSNDFSVAYILHHSNRALPGPYKFAALWSGQEGSLLLWAWLLTGYGFVLRLRHKVDVKLTAYASTILAGIQVFFLLLLNFAAPPFSLVSGTVPQDGFGLNPLLQYPEMVIHPPMLYLGYVGFSVPFAFALGALMMRYPGEKWIHITRRWTMVTWLFLTCGIFLGAHWAYSVLGWGGYWGWDPVENASLFPWLTGTAFLHSVMMQEKRGMLKTWNVWLIFCTFMLSILGTFLTRSGVVSSVHAFAQSSIGDWFLWFLACIFVVCLFFYIRNRDHLRSEHRLESLISRESSFLFQNLVLLAACFAVLWGTLFPILSEAIQGRKETVGPPFFNRVNIPIALFLLLLTAVGPLLAWRRTSWASLKRNFTIPAIVALATAALLMALGVRPWTDSSQLYALMAISLAALVTATVASEFIRGGRVIARHTGQNLLASMVTLTRRNTRRYGGYIVHFGVVSSSLDSPALHSISRKSRRWASATRCSSAHIRWSATATRRKIMPITPSSTPS